MQPTTFDLMKMTPEELRAEIDRRIVEAIKSDPEMQAAIAADEEEEVNHILYGDPDAPPTKFRKRRLKGSQLIVKETAK